jgi:Zn-dependent protease with chaperone function
MVDGWVSWLRKWGTCLYARLTLGTIQEVSEFSVAGVSREVYWFDSGSRKGGHTTPFNTVTMNRQLLEDLSDSARDYVFIHEVGHSKVGFPFNVLMYALLIPTLVMAMFSPFVAAATIFDTWISTNSFYSTITAAIAGIVIVIFFTGLFTTISWLSEGHAELYAVRKLGKEEYLQISEEIKEYADRSRIRKVRHRVKYPPPRLVTWFSEKI